MADTDERRNRYLDKVGEAFALLAEIGLPETYLEPLRMDVTKAALEAADPGWASRVHCYLMFFGSGRSATHVKIGVSNRPSQRLTNLRTGNPLEPLWAYSFPYEDRKAALLVERRLHGHFASNRASGEWFKIEPAGPDEARALANGAYRMAAGVRKPCGPLAQVEF